jgi:hypothetical protein
MLSRLQAQGTAPLDDEPLKGARYITIRHDGTSSWGGEPTVIRPLTYVPALCKTTARPLIQLFATTFAATISSEKGKRERARDEGERAACAGMNHTR